MRAAQCCMKEGMGGIESVEGMAIIPLVQNDVKTQSVFKGSLLRGFKGGQILLGLD